MERPQGRLTLEQNRTALCCRTGIVATAFDEWQSEEYPVLLEWTRCNYGGERAWFRCPVRGRGRRVAVLWGGGIFACRQCHNLAYESQNETTYSRALSKAQTIHVKVGGEPGFAYDFPSKPKGMRWRTYNRLRAEADEAEKRSWVYRMMLSVKI